METLVIVIMCLIVLKSLILGSDFSISYWIKYKNTYWRWYKQRESFKEYLKRS